MSYLNTIRKKILAANGLMLALLLIILVYVFFTLNANRHLLIEQQSAVAELEAISLIEQVFYEYNLVNAEFIMLLQNTDKTRRDELFTKLVNLINDSDEAEIKGLSHHVKEHYQKLSATAAAFIDDDRMSGNYKLAQAKLVSDKIASKLLEQMTIKKANEKRFFGLVSTSNQRVSTALYILLASTIVCGIGIPILLANMINANLTKLTEVINHIESKGDLTLRAELNTNDEIGILAKAFNRLLDNLFNIVSDVQDKGNILVDSAIALSKLTENTRDGVDDQFQEISLVATSMVQMEASVNEVANICQQAAELSSNSKDESQSGNTVVNATINAIDELASDVKDSADVIDELKSRSENIGSVLDVIKNISEQTNLLALNAAIEAARAGEQGRGFAVVSDEVRNLAQRTKESTVEIEDLVESLQRGAQNAFDRMQQSRHKTEDTVNKARETGNSLETINTSIQNIADLSTQIAAAAEEQSTTVEEISRNISKIRSVSEETSGSVGQTYESSKTVNNVGLQLQTLVGKFKVS